MTSDKNVTTIDIRAGQVWQIPTNSAKAPVFREIKIQAIDDIRGFIHYYYLDDHGIRPIKLKPIASFRWFVQTNNCRLVQDVE